MKLYYGAASPFVRKVAICIAELGLSDKVEFVACPTTPLNPNPDLAGANPIIKIPALELDNGTVLFDSSVICEYLDSLSDKATLVPASGDARWATLRLQAMANGAMEAGVLVRYETFLRPEALRWDDWTNAQMSKVNSVLKGMDAEAAGFGDKVDLGIITAACICGYMDFRFTDTDWRAANPALAKWFASFKARSSMVSTEPS
jgi:glutathione S-transferase